ncbi:exosome complex component CSL4-like [Styela clava]
MAELLKSSQICVPGERLASAEHHRAGFGTYVKRGYIFASLAGMVRSEQNDKDIITVSVRSKHHQQLLPQIDSIVTCKVTGISGRFAKCLITAVNNARLSEPLRGIIRREDVRAKDIEKVEIPKCFRPGDVVLAKVLSLGDASSYLLTTAENGLGVVLARSEAGELMLPISWQEMQCPVSYVKESRKVARPQEHYLKQ